MECTSFLRCVSVRRSTAAFLCVMPDADVADPAAAADNCWRVTCSWAAWPRVRGCAEVAAIMGTAVRGPGWPNARLRDSLSLHLFLLKVCASPTSDPCSSDSEDSRRLILRLFLEQMSSSGSAPPAPFVSWRPDILVGYCNACCNATYLTLKASYTSKLKAWYTSKLKAWYTSKLKAWYTSKLVVTRHTSILILAYNLIRARARALSLSVSMPETYYSLRRLWALNGTLSHPIWSFLISSDPL
jgi:hypothetical protein